MSRQIMQQALDALKELKMTQSMKIHWAIAALEAELAKPTNEFHPDWDTLKPYHDRIAELEAQLAKPEYSDLRAAAEMALEYLEYLNELEIAGLDHEVHTNALRQALAQPEQSILICSNCGADRTKEGCKGERTYCPFAGHAQQDYGFDRTASHMAGEYVDTAEQEPVAWVNEHNTVIIRDTPPDDFIYSWKPLYTSPPRKEWVGLTDDEIKLMAHNDDDGDWNDPRYRDCWHEGYVEGAHAAQVALRSKNEP